MGGLFGVVSKEGCESDLWFGTDYQSHLGADSAGLATLGKKLFEPISHSIRGTPFKTAFRGDFKILKGHAGIGVVSDRKNDCQPILMSSNLGNFSIGTIGNIKNARMLFNELKKDGATFKYGCNPTEIAGELIARGDSIISGIENMYKRIYGSVSLVLISEDERCIYASGDISPLALGKNTKSTAVVTDTTSFLKLGYKIADTLRYREIVNLDESGDRERVKTTEINIMCPFFFTYTGFPTYEMYGINGEVVRERCGGFLAEEDDIEADFVFGVESSGLPHATGYAKRKLEILKEGIASILEDFDNKKIGNDDLNSKIEKLLRMTPPLRRASIKYIEAWARSYIPSEQKLRSLIADKKQIPNPHIIRNKIALLIDDSIRRGTQLLEFKKNNLDPYNPREVHGRIGTPVQMFPCFYDDRTKMRDLASYKAISVIEGKNNYEVERYLDENSSSYSLMVKRMGDNIGLDSLKFISLEQMIKAIVEAPGNQGLRRENLCTYCWNGIPPIKQCSN